MSARQQTEIVANWIMQNCPEEIGNEGAGDVAIRLLEKYRNALLGILNELGVPGEGYPAPVTNAYDYAKNALTPSPKPHDFDENDVDIEMADENYLQCSHVAKWAIFNNNSDTITFSCTEHLSLMVNDATVSIKVCANTGITKDYCDYIYPRTE